MDAVTYLKTYERMRNAEGLLSFEPLFNADATAEEKVSLVEEWGRENPAIEMGYEVKLGKNGKIKVNNKELADKLLEIADAKPRNYWDALDEMMGDIEHHRNIISELHMLILQMQIKLDDLEDEMRVIREEVL